MLEKRGEAMNSWTIDIICSGNYSMRGLTT
jgi:hypothetical protein